MLLHAGVVSRLLLHVGGGKQVVASCWCGKQVVGCWFMLEVVSCTCTKLVGWLLALRSSNMLAYLRDRSAETSGVPPHGDRSHTSKVLSQTVPIC